MSIRTLAVLVAIVLPSMTFAGSKKHIKAANARGPTASAAEIPALAQLLEKAGWDPTPELSGVFQVGRIFLDDGEGHSLMVRECFAAEAGEDTYTSAEVVTQLQAGVRVKLGVEVGSSGSLEKKVKFDTPVHHTLERLAMVPTPECTALLAQVSSPHLAQMYAVQEVLSARITEQTCGRLNAEGKFVLGSADAELERLCSQESLEPVAVAYRTIPLGELDLPSEEPSASHMPPSPPEAFHVENHWPDPVSEECYWGIVKSVHSTHTTLTLNGHTMDVRGTPNRTRIVTELQECGYLEAAEAFNEWRESRRTTNISCATLAGCYPFGVGLWSAVMAKKHRLRMERSLLQQRVARVR